MTMIYHIRWWCWHHELRVFSTALIHGRQLASSILPQNTPKTLTISDLYSRLIGGSRQPLSHKPLHFDKFNLFPYQRSDTEYVSNFVLCSREFSGQISQEMGKVSLWNDILSDISRKYCTIFQKDEPKFADAKIHTVTNKLMSKAIKQQIKYGKVTEM